MEKVVITALSTAYHQHIGGQLSKNKTKRHVCDYCLNYFGSEDLLIKHTKYCSKHEAVNAIFPERGKNDELKFKHVQNCVECPIKIYADFESFLKPINKTHGKTILYQKHTPSAFCLNVVSRVEGFSMEPITYSGEDAEKVFVEKLENSRNKSKNGLKFQFL